MKRLQRWSRILASWTFVAGLTGVSGICYAQEGDKPPDFESFGTGSVFWMLFKVIGFLVIIIGIFLAIIKIVAQKNRGFHAGRSIKPLGGLGVGPNKSVQVVQIGRSLYVLGVGNDVELISKIDDPDEIEEIVSRIHSNVSGAGNGFPTVMEWWKGIRVRKNSTSEEWEDASSFQAVFQEKMQRLASRQKKVDEMIARENQDERLNDKP